MLTRSTQRASLELGSTQGCSSGIMSQGAPFLGNRQLIGSQATLCISKLKQGRKD